MGFNYRMMIVCLLAFCLTGCCNGVRHQQEQQITHDMDADDTLVTIDWYIHLSNYRRSWNLDTSLIDKIISEKTGVNINMMTAYGSNADENIMKMLASDDTPDIITVDRYYDIFHVVQNSGKFHDYNNLIDTYVPGFRQEIPQSMIDTYTMDNGEWYAFISFFNAPEFMGEDNYMKTNNACVARQDIMQQLGIKPEDFKTEEGMYEALLKVKESGMTYKGKELIPFISLFNGWGIIEYASIPLEDQEGNLVMIEKSLEYLERLKFLNKLLREGLMSYDIFTATNEQIQEMVKEGRVFCFNGTLPRAAMAALYKEDPSAKYVPVEPVRNPDGRRPYVQSGMAGWTGTFVSKNTEHPEAIMKLIQFLYSEEGQMLTSFGVEGVTYEIVDGRVQYTQVAIEAKEDGTYDSTYGAEFWPMLEPFFVQKMQELPVTDVDRMFHDIDRYYSQFVYNDLPFVTMIPKEASVYSTRLQKSALFDLTNILLAKSAEEVEQAYNKALDRLKQSGYDDVINYENTVFQKNKQRANIERAWPSYHHDNE